MGLAVGIDLGTTNSVVAVCGGNGRPKAVENFDGDTVSPSVIAVDDDTGNLVVGVEAAQLFNYGLAEGAALFKRQMGLSSSIAELLGQAYTPTDLSAALLRGLIDQAEERLGYRPDQAVVTVPAYFQNAEREATRQAVTDAGLECLQLINEPTAAAIAFRMDQEDSAGRVLVYDLGGGTFDVTILDTGNLGEVLQSSGDPNLGGADWDSALMDILLEEARDHVSPHQLENERFLNTIRHEAEKAKQRLSSSNRARVAISFEGEAFRTEISRETFEEATAHLVRQTMDLVEEAINASGLSRSDIDDVLLVGGSTRMPMIEEALGKAFSKKPRKVLNPDHAVAFGAALKAAALTAEAQSVTMFSSRETGLIAINDITNFSLGVIAATEDGSRYVNTIMIPTGKRLPAEGLQSFQHVFHDGDGPSLELYVTQGDGTSPDEVNYLGYYTLDRLPGAKIGAPCSIEIGYSYDASGIGNARVRAAGDRDWTDFERADLPSDAVAKLMSGPQMSAGPISVLVWFDVSGSMSGAPLKEAKEAAKAQFANNPDLDGAEIGIGVVADSSEIVLHPTTDRRALAREIDRIEVGHEEVGFSNLNHPFGKTLNHFEGKPGSRTSVVLADGMWANTNKAVQSAQKCKDEGIQMLCVAFGSADLDFLHEISSSPDLSFHANFGELNAAFGTIARQISTGAMRMG